MIRGADLPAAAIRSRVTATLADSAGVVVTAPPGAGKSTLLPLAIMEDFPSDGRIIMLEPRRIAALQIAERMAWMIGEEPGGLVGYRVRFDSRVGPHTRLEVITEGILTRMMTEDPTLDGISVLIFDEFHERSLASDTALALARECVATVRPDLKIVIMSATIDAESICSALSYPLVESPGKMFPVSFVYLGDCPAHECADAVARAVLKACSEEEGDVLAFLPGEAEIRRCCDLLQPSLPGCAVYPLYGMLSAGQQRAAVMPSGNGRRRIVVATPVAETSLTIEGVRIVVDSGYCKKLVYDARTSLSHLETVRISMDMAGQRAGRAGRLCPGVCYRLWNKAQELSMAPCRKPEILESDLCRMVLDIAVWGESRPERLDWLTPPPADGIASARRILTLTGACDENGLNTPEGRRIAALPCHPRIARMLIVSETPQLKSLACDIAAILEEKDPLSVREYGCDISLRINRLRDAREYGSSRGMERLIKTSAQYRQLCDAPVDNNHCDPYAAGLLLSRAYPERVACLFDSGCGRFRLASSEMACTDRDDPVSSCAWIVAAAVNSGSGKDGRIFLAAPVDVTDLYSIAHERENVGWDSRQGRVVARTETAVGCLVLSTREIDAVPEDSIKRVICNAVAKDGMSLLDFSDRIQQLQKRIAAVAGWHPEMELPDVSAAAMLRTAGEWLPPFLNGIRTSDDLMKIDLEPVIWSIAGYGNKAEIERLAPEYITVPSGSRIRIEYRTGADKPVLRVRLQECFGMADGPRLDEGRVPVLMELLSPGFKPVQLTTDLKSFWSGAYFEVRKELKRRYPKHHWPDNPLESEAVRGVKKH